MELAEGTYTVLARADRALSAKVAERFGGLPVDDRTVAFRSTAQAVRCAVALAQESPTAIGVHAGEIAGGDPHDARPVLLAARLAALAREGQVLASAVVRELVVDDPDVRMGEAREVSLPGLAGRRLEDALHPAASSCAGIGRRPRIFVGARARSRRSSTASRCATGCGRRCPRCPPRCRQRRCCVGLAAIPPTRRSRRSSAFRSARSAAA